MLFTSMYMPTGGSHNQRNLKNKPFICISFGISNLSLITMDLVCYRSQLTLKIQENLGLGTGPTLWCTGLSFWIQWRSPFLWSWQQGFCTRVRVPSWASEDSNCSNTLTICQNSGLLSGFKDQHCSINARIAGGQFEGITGLEFWRNTIPHDRSIRIAWVDLVIWVSQ